MEIPTMTNGKHVEWPDHEMVITFVDQCEQALVPIRELVEQPGARCLGMAGIKAVGGFPLFGDAHGRIDPNMSMAVALGQQTFVICQSKHTSVPNQPGQRGMFL